MSLIRRLGALFDRPLPPATDTTVPRSAAELAQLAQNVEREHPRLAWEVRAIASHLRTFETATAARSGNTR